MKLLILLSIFFINAFAGDGGYTLFTCKSNSGRTVLTILNDEYSDSRVPTVINLVVDGYAVAYRTDVNQDLTIKVASEKAGELNYKVYDVMDRVVLNVDVSKVSYYKYNAIIRSESVDPRVGTEMQSYITGGNNDIYISCSMYERQP